MQRWFKESRRVGYTDARRDTGTKTVQVLSHFNLEFFLHALQSCRARVGAEERRSRLERKAVPGKDCSSLEEGRAGERKGKVSLPGAKPATVFKPAWPRFPTARARAHTHTHTANC